MAGRSLDRALKKLHSNHNKSSTSLKSMSSEVIHADNASRPGTPGTEPPMSSAILEQLKGIQNAYAAAKSDNAFLRALVEQNTKERAILVTAVETLQAESKSKSLCVQCIFVIGLLAGRKHGWRPSV
jgi:actin-related protein